MVVGDLVHDGVRYFLIRQAHGSTYQIPEWMFAQEASALAIVAIPRLPVGQLILLRRFADQLMANFPGSKIPEGSAMKRLSYTQLDLFVISVEPVALTDAERQMAGDEEVYLKVYDSVSEARASIGRYLAVYNEGCPHSSLDGHTPDEADFDEKETAMAAPTSPSILSQLWSVNRHRKLALTHF